MRDFDLISGLNFVLETLYYDAISTKNKILFEYDPSYPRIFKIDGQYMLKIVEYTIKSILYSTRHTRIKTTFKLTNYNAKSVFFRISIKADKEIKTDQTYINKLKNTIKDADYDIFFNKDHILIDANMPLGKKISDSNANLKSDSIKKYHAIIAYDDKDGFKILSKQLEYIGISTRPKHNYLSLKKHLLDAIYKPNVVFLHRKFIDNKDEFNQILEYKNKKNFSIIAICDEDDSFDEDVRKDITILRQPCTYDTLYTILNAIHSNRQK